MKTKFISKAWPRISVVRHISHIGLIIFLFLTATCAVRVQAAQGDNFTLTATTKVGEVTFSSEQQDFAANQPPKFEITKEKSGGLTGVGQSANSLLQGVIDVFTDKPENNIEIKVVNNNDEEVYQETKNYSEIDSTIEIPTDNLKPGTYTLEATDVSSGTTYEQDFTWGVLAINTNKDIYKPGDEVKFSIAVLDETGEMICNANLRLEIKIPGVGTQSTPGVETLSTENGTVKVNEEICRSKEYTLTPDYEATFDVEKPGTYEMALSAETQNGTYTIKDSFQVQENIDFEIERTTPTRIFPPVDYPMILKVTPNMDFEGIVQDKISEKFRFYYTDEEEIKDKFAIDIDLDETAITIPGPVEDGYKFPTWEVNWEKGQTYYLAYWFKSPNQSPDFYTLGPIRMILTDEKQIETDIENKLEIGNWQLENPVFVEHRLWMLAIDLNSTLYPDGNVTTGNWTTYGTCTLGEYDCIEEGTTSPDDTNYLYTSPNPTNIDHVHTVSNSPSDVGTVTQIDFKVRAKKDPSNKTASVDIYYSTDSSDPTTLAGQITSAQLTGTFQVFTRTVSSLSLSKIQIDNLRVKLRANGTAGGAPWVSSAEYYITYTAASGDTISGYAYTGEGTGADSTANICVRQNNSAEECVDTDGSGQYTTSTLITNAGDQLTVFYNNGTEFGNTVTVTNGGNLSNLNVYQGHVIIRNDNSGSTTIANMANYDRPDNTTDIFYTAVDSSPDYLTIEDGYELYIPSTHTFAPGGNLENGTAGIDDIKIVGTYTAAAGQTIRVSGSWVNSGTFTSSTSTVTFDASSGSESINSTGATTSDFSAITFNAGGGGTTWTLGSALVATGTFTNTSGTVNTGNYQVTFGGTFSNSGTFTAGSSNIVLSGTTATPTISGFTTTGTVSMTKTGGTATFQSAVNAGGLTINGSGGTLNLGTGLTHTFSGTWTRTAGTLNGGSSTINFSLAGTVFSGSGSTFTAGTGTVAYTNAAAQTFPALTYNNLTLSGGGIKTVATTPTVNGTLSMQGTATIVVTTGVVTYGASAKLQYNTTTGRTASSEEWLTTFAATGGVQISSTGTITLNEAKIFSAGVPLLVDSGASLTTNNYQLSLGGNFTTTGATFTAGSSSIVIGAGTATQSISGFTTTGACSMTKTGGTATLGANTTCASFTFNGSGGTLNDGGFTITITGTGAVWTKTAGTYTTTGTAKFTGTSPTIGASNFNNLTIDTTGSNTATLTGTATVAGNLTVTSGILDLSTFTANRGSAGGTLTVSNGATLKIGSTNTIPSNYTTHSIGATSTIDFAGSTQTIPALNSSQNYGNLTISTAGTKSLGTSITVTTTLNITSGTLDDAGYPLNSDGTINLNSGSFKLGSAGAQTSWPSFSANNITAGSTVEYASGVAQTVSTTPSYSNLTFSGAGTKTTAPGTLSIGSNWAVGSTTALNSGNTIVSLTGTLSGSGSITQGSGLITIGGDWTNTGTFTASSAGVTMTGSGKQITGPGGGITFTTLTINGTVTNNNAGTVVVGTALSGSGTLTQGSSVTLNIGGTSGITALDAYTNSNTVNYTGAGQTINSNNYVNLTLSGSGTPTLQAGTTAISGNFTLSGTVSVATAAILDINGNVSVGEGTTFTINHSCDITGDLTTTTTGIIANSSGTPTVTMSGAGKSIGGGAGAITFYGLTLANDGTTTVNSDITISNTLNVTTSDTMSIAASKYVTATTTLTFPDTATISGSGTLVYQGSSTFPTTGTLSTPLRFDATNNDHTVPVRTYSGAVEFYNGSNTNPRTITLGSDATALTFGSSVTLNSAGSQTVSVAANGSNPAINITGALSGTSGGTAELLTTGSGIWTVTGAVDLTGVTLTATGGTFRMNGTANLTSATNTFNNFSVTGNSVSAQDATDIDGNFSVTSGAFAMAGGAVNMTVAGNFSLSLGTSFTGNTAGGKLIFNGTTYFTDSRSPVADIGDVQIGNSPGDTYLSSDFSANSLTVVNGDNYYTCGWEVDIGNGGITINGNFDATRTAGGCSSDTDQSTINDYNLFNLSGTGSFVPDQSTIIFDDNSGTNNLTTAGSGSFYNMEVNGASNTMLLKDALDVDNNLTITAGTLDVESGSNWQINVGGNWTNDATFEERAGKVVLDGTTSTTVDTNCSDVTTCTNENFYDLEINKTAVGDDDDNVTISNFGIRATNTITVTNGELVQGAYNVQVEDTSASGTAVTITSDGKWYNISTGNLTIGGDFSNAGTATFQGNGTACGDNDDISISSLDSPTDYNWAGAGTFTINDITCSDMTSTPTINAYSSTNSGSTCGANWNFVECPMDITGTVYNFGTSNALTECDGTSQTLELRVAGTTQTTSCDNDNGTFTFSSVPGPNSGDGLVIWIDSTISGGTKGALVTRYDGAGSSDNNVFYDDAVVITSDDTNAVDILDMNFYDKGDDGDIPYTAADADPDTLSVDSGYDLLVRLKSGVAADSTVFDPGGTVAIGGSNDLDIGADATCYLDTATNSIGGDLLVAGSSTLYIDANTTVGGGDITTSGTSAAVSTSSGSPTVTVTTAGGTIGGGTTPTLTFHNLTTSGSSSLDIANTATVNNVLTVGANTTLTNSAAATVTNNVTVNGTLTVGASLNIDGGSLTTGSGATVDYSSTPTVDIDGTGTLGGNSVTTQFYDLDLGDGTSDTTTLGSGTQVDNSLTVNSNHTFAMSTYDVTVGSTGASGSGDIAVNGATSQSASGTLTIKSSAAGEADLTGSGTLTVYNLTVGDSATAMTLDQDSADTAIDIANDLTITASATFSATSGTGLNVQGSYSNSGTFTANGGRITFDDADGGETLSGTMTGGSAFYDIVFDDGGGSGTWSFGNNNATVTHDFTITDGTVTAPGSGYTLTIAQDFNNNDASGSFVHNSGTVVFDTTADSILSYAADTTFNNFTVTTATKTVKFDDTYQINVAGLFNIQGTNCDNLIYLDSETNDDPWDIYVSGTFDIDYVDVEDSTAVTTALTANNSTEVNEGNTNWTVNGGLCEVTEHSVNIRGDTNIKGNTRIK